MSVDYKQLANELLAHLVEGWGVKDTENLLSVLGYSENEIKSLDIIKEEE
jgi:hypothetical protein